MENLEVEENKNQQDVLNFDDQIIEDDVLEIGKKYKYSQLVELLDDTYYECKKSRKCQLKRWAKRYDLELDGKKYLVKNIHYDSSIPAAQTKEEQQRNRNLIYGIILCYLQEQSQMFNTDSDYAVCFLSRSDFQRIAGFTNEFYLYNDTTKKESFEKFYPQIATELESEVNKFAYDTIRNCLKSLQQDGLINYREEKQIIKADNDSQWVLASLKEIDQLREIWKRGLDKFHIKHGYQAYSALPSIRKAFFEYIGNEMREIGILQKRNAFCIWLPKDFVSEQLKKLSLDKTGTARLSVFIKAINETTITKMNERTEKNITKRRGINVNDSRYIFNKWIRIMDEIDREDARKKDEEFMPNNPNCVELAWDDLEGYESIYRKIRKRGINSIIKIPYNIEPEKQIEFLSSRNSNVSSDIFSDNFDDIDWKM